MIDKKFEPTWFQIQLKRVRTNLYNVRRILLYPLYNNYSLYQSNHSQIDHMIKKPSLHQGPTSKHASLYLKSDHNNQNHIHKKPLSTHSHQTAYHSKTSKPLRQITNQLPLTYKQPKKDHQKCLKSQTSIADLSEIVAIQLSSAQKKQSHIRQVQPNDKPQPQNLDSINNFYMRRQQKQAHPPESQDNSLRLDDFEILDVYQATAIKKADSIDTVQSDLRSRRKSGGIRRNSRVFSNQEQLLPKTNTLPKYQQFPQINSDQKDLTSKQSTRNSSQQHTRRSSVDISQILDEEIRKCGQKMFKSVCNKNKSLTEKDLQKTRLTCEMRLILGPIVTMFKQKKYSELNLQAFGREFGIIMKDFTPKESLQIVKKIQQDKFLEIIQDFDHCETESAYVNEPQSLIYLSKSTSKLFNATELPLKQSHSKSLSKPIPQQQVSDNTQKRLQKLTSKVDSFLNKISNQYNPGQRQQMFEKHKASNLMSRLTEIEQLSGDSEDFASKRDSLPNEVTEVDEITKDVYVGVSERKVLEEEQCESRYCREEIFSQENQVNQRQLQENDRLSRDSFMLDSLQSYEREYNPFKKQVMYPPYQSQFAQSTKRKLFNHSQLITKQRQSLSNKIHERLFPESSPESTSRISFKTVNLQFSELSKYLY